MNLILLDPGELASDCRVVLRGRRARHIRTVLRSAPGDRLRVGMIRGPLGVAEVVEAARGDEAVLDICWQDAIEAPPPVDLVLAVPRPKALAKTLRIAACLGARRIDLVNAWRVDKSHLHAHALAPEALRHNLLLGCEQGGTTWLPDIEVHRLLMPFVRGPLADRLADPSIRLAIAHPRAGRMLEDAIQPGRDAPVIAAIGPERGWIDRELTSFVELGGAAVSLGSRVLDVQTAVAAFLSQLDLLTRLSVPRHHHRIT